MFNQHLIQSTYLETYCVHNISQLNYHASIMFDVFHLTWTSVEPQPLPTCVRIHLTIIEAPEKSGTRTQTKKKSHPASECHLYPAIRFIVACLD